MKGRTFVARERTGENGRERERWEEPEPEREEESGLQQGGQPYGVVGPDGRGRHVLAWKTSINVGGRSIYVSTGVFPAAPEPEIGRARRRRTVCTRGALVVLADTPLHGSTRR